MWQAHEGNLSGANIALLEYIDALESHFDFWVVLPHGGSMIQALELRSIPFSVIHQYGWTNSFPRWKILKWLKVVVRSIMAIWQIKRLIRNLNVSIVCSNTLVPFTASAAAKQLGVPHIWWIHEFGKEDFGFKIGWGYEKVAYRWIQSSSQLIIGNSKAISAKFSKLMPKANIVSIYQPVSWNQHSAIHPISKKARFLIFGQLVASKGHITVLNAMSVIKKLGKQVPSLHIIGPSEQPSYLKELKDLVNRYGLVEHVHIEVGFFEKEKTLPCYEVLIVASNCEAFGRVIVEANKSGISVLVRNSGGAPELINDSNGLLFQSQDELMSALCGEREFPASLNLHLNYDESFELEKLTHKIKEVCS